ncbi:MAG: acetyltransferase [Gammaproteobacteria bacterium]|nr:acetyltransferase [Gammaproteobacteria bacterium]PCH62047.1 MAG: acetyltransferase [Gammaproteobacteria bacterium]
MFLTEKTSGDLVEIISVSDLFNPYRTELVGRYNCGEEAQGSDKFQKARLSFLSGEGLPRC